MGTERTNLQLTSDAGRLQVRAAALESRATLNYDDNLSKAGLKDASGANRDIFIDVSILYLKQYDKWYYIYCSSIGL